MSLLRQAIGTEVIETLITTCQYLIPNFKLIFVLSSDADSELVDIYLGKKQEVHGLTICVLSIYHILWKYLMKIIKIIVYLYTLQKYVNKYTSLSLFNWT